MDYERIKLIEDLKALKLNYNFSKYSNDQLKAIRDKERTYRFKLCCEINNLAREINQEKGHDIEYLFHQGGTKEELKQMKQRALEIIEKRDIRRHIKYLIDELELDPNEVVELTIKRQPETLEDYKSIRDILLKKYEDKNNPLNKKENINYDKSYALGDDPIMSRIEYEVILPKEKVEKMIILLDSLRRKTSPSSYIRRLSKEFYSRLTKKYRNLDENYQLLDTYDFEYLINFFNKATEGLKIDSVEEIKYRHYR